MSERARRALGHVDIPGGGIDIGFERWEPLGADRSNVDHEAQQAALDAGGRGLVLEVRADAALDVDDGHAVTGWRGALVVLGSEVGAGAVALLTGC